MRVLSPPKFVDSSGQEYQLQIVVSPRGSAEFALDTSAIQSLDYQMQLNDLVTRGSIIYTDSNGVFDSMLCQPYGMLRVEFQHYNTEFDGEITASFESEDPGIDSDFLIENISILERHRDVITYKILFTSVHILNCISTVDFSNYGKDPEPVLDILRQIAVKNNIDLDKESFGSVKHQPKMNYITNGNDNVFTSMKFLLDKLYYTFPRSESMVFILWDELSHQLRLFDMSNQKTLTGRSQIILSMFDAFTESASGGVSNELGTVTKFPSSAVAITDSSSQMAIYDYKTNKFSYDNIKQSQHRQYINNHFQLDENIQNKYKGIDVQIIRRGSFWNNDFHFYGTFIDTFLSNNALIVKAAGNIMRIPGSIVDICVDRGDSQQYSEDPHLYEEMMRRYQGLDGIWIVVKVHNYIKPGADKSDAFRQVITLSRNFTYPVE